MTTPNEARPEWEPVAWRVWQVAGNHRSKVLEGSYTSQSEADAAASCLGTYWLGTDMVYGPAVRTEMVRAQEEARVLREALPPWLQYDPQSDVLTIHGKRYAACLFGPEGFLAPPGTHLEIVEGLGDVVTCRTLP